MRSYARGAREEQKYDSSQDHDPTVGPAIDRGEMCNYGLFDFASVVWLKILKLFFISLSLSSKKGENR